MNQGSSLPRPPASVHFVGIGGIGMSGLARILAARGYRISGSDASTSALVDQLRAEGISIQIGHEETERVTAAELVVATAAVRETNAEIHAARERGIPVIKRAELLGLLANDRLCVAVAGSHGKSSTSGMLVTALQAAGRDPSYAIGAILTSTGTNAAPGSGEAMIVEADEYDYSFLWLRPKIAIITNIDYDHPDLFSDQDAYDAAFLQFAQGMKENGVIIVNGDDAGVQRVLDRLRARCTVITYGSSAGCDWRIAGSCVQPPAGDPFSLDLVVPGQHNRSNATAALAAMDQMGVPLAEATLGLTTYRGVGRRFEQRGEIGGVTVIDDYAHHPREIAATIAAARDKFPGRRIIVAFQPHTYSRTKSLLGAFAEALSAADRVLVLDIYPARETDTLGVSAIDMVRRMDRGMAETGGDPVDAVARLAAEVVEGDVVLTMGAGDVTLVGPRLLQVLEAKH